MKRIIGIQIFLSLFFVLSCTDKAVQLPKISVEGISEIHNHSSIWIFFEVQGKDTLAVLNKNNKILNTHWIFNIDRRLPMKLVIPHLQKMQKNKNKDSMHKKEGMLNYFSYANTKNKNISLINFNPTTYIKYNSKNSDIEVISFNNEFIEIDIQNDQIILNKNAVKLAELSEFIDILELKDTIESPKIILKYSENTTYQNYLNAKVHIQNQNISIEPEEYIYSVK